MFVCYCVSVVLLDLLGFWDCEFMFMSVVFVRL